MTIAILGIRIIRIRLVRPNRQPIYTIDDGGLKNTFEPSGGISGTGRHVVPAGSLTHHLERVGRA